MHALWVDEACNFLGKRAILGQEAAPMPGSAAWREDHASLDVARAFALCADVGDDSSCGKAWPVLSGVAEWIKSRVTKRRGKYEIRSSMGIAERKSPLTMPFSLIFPRAFA